MDVGWVLGRGRVVWRVGEDFGRVVDWAWAGQLQVQLGVARVASGRGLEWLGATT